ncbi:MAG: tetratricopeptide repeat protein, partial [Algicola sp.]|nr:tetratricopeptide repeat protein [Algicola sp.]
VLPKRCKSSIIVTSRDQDLADTLKIQRSKLKITASNIQAFDADECLSLFYRLLEDNYQTEQEPIYLSIAEQLGFLPIALRLAISTMMFGSRYSATQLLNELESGNKLNLIDEALRHEANSDERSIAAVFDLSAPLLTPEHKKVLAKLAVCAPGGVPLDFLKQLGTTLKASVLTNSLEALVRFSWCKQTNVDDVAHYELHQLVRELIQAQLVDEKLKKLHTDTVHRVFIVKPQHFLKLDRWISQTNSAVLRLKAGKDERLVDWAGGDFWQFCSNRGHVERFVQYCEWVIECFDHKQNWVAMALGHQASALESWEQLDKAMVLYKKEEVIRKTLNDQKGLAGCFCNQASILRLKNQPDEAILLYRKAEVINQKFGNQLWLAICYGNRALTLRKKGLPDEAMALLKKAEVTYKKLQNQSELANCYSNQALILNDKHQLEEAMALFKKAATISDTLGDREGLARCYWSQGSVHNKLGNLQTQKDLWRKSIALIKQHGLPTENEETALAGLDSRFLRFKMKIVAWLRKEVAKKV